VSTSDAAGVVERAVAAFTARAERDETATDDPRRDEVDAFAAELERCLALDPQTALELVTPYLSSDNPFERAAAARIIGRLGEANPDRVSRPSSELLFARLLGEDEGEARDSIACGLGLIWNASGDEASPLELASHPNANVRFAAAQNLALTTTAGPGDAEARAALQALLDDPDEGVRGWAEVGLAGLSPA
jgi:HEAT repeat protein